MSFKLSIVDTSSPALLQSQNLGRGRRRAAQDFFCVSSLLFWRRGREMEYNHNLAITP
jgi:hypothetical protein